MDKKIAKKEETKVDIDLKKDLDPKYYCRRAYPEREIPADLFFSPIQHPDIWEMYKKQEASIWTAEELDSIT